MPYDTTEAKRLADAADKALEGVRPTEEQLAEMIRPTLAAFEEASGSVIKRITDSIYESLLEGVQDYLRQNAEWNLSNDIRRADRIDRENEALAASLRDAVAEIERLREALREAADAMTCGPDKHGDNPAHYCPNCDNTSFNARANIRALLGGDHGHD